MNTNPVNPYSPKLHTWAPPEEHFPLEFPEPVPDYTDDEMDKIERARLKRLKRAKNKGEMS